MTLGVSFPDGTFFVFSKENQEEPTTCFGGIHSETGHPNIERLEPTRGSPGLTVFHPETVRWVA